ncbi:MAG TPA: GNAT family N-acetyltransferase [Nocardioidaceae bacterium]|nr:GNAT family N-acetyltransferase [Nocardioidaceae bacterium]
MPDIDVRAARPDDLDRVVDCQEACWHEAYDGLVPARYLDDSDLPTRRRERWSRRIAGERQVIIAIEGEDVVGVGSAGPCKDDDVAPAVELMSLYVRKRLWRSGIGARMLAALVGDGDAYLWVFEDNQRARDFYAAHGFRPDGAGQLDPGTNLWEIRMVRRSADGPARMAAAGLVDYRSDVDDNLRWADFAVRGGDVVISTRSKSGTTWMQQICGLLVFQSPTLPQPLAELSPWLDHLVVAQDAVFARLAGQRHRRIVKTHTPLDGIRVVDEATYIVVARQPIDMAVSLYHQGANLDRERIASLAGQPPPEPSPERPPLHEWLVEWVDGDAEPLWLESIHGVLAHVADARSRATRNDNVVVVRYEDLLADLDGQMRLLSDRLGIAVDDAVWPSLVAAATLESMRANVDAVVPDPAGIMNDHSAFLRRGSAGAGRETLTDDEYAHYRQRVRSLSSPELDAWLHG